MGIDLVTEKKKEKLRKRLVARDFNIEFIVEPLLFTSYRCWKQSLINLDYFGLTNFFLLNAKLYQKV